MTDRRREGAPPVANTWHSGHERQSFGLPARAIFWSFAALGTTVLLVGLLGTMTVVVGVAAISITMLAIALSFKLDWAAPHALAESAGASEEDFPVRVTYVCRDLPYAQEEGVAAFVDGWLVFRGTASDWSLRNSDAHMSDLIGGQTLEFRDGFTVRLRGLARMSRGPVSRVTGFGRAYLDWARDPVRREGVPVLPPRRERRHAQLLMLPALVASAVLGGALGSIFANLVTANVSVAVVLGTIFVPQAVLIWRRHVLRRALDPSPDGRSEELKP